MYRKDLQVFFTGFVISAKRIVRLHFQLHRKIRVLVLGLFSFSVQLFRCCLQGFLHEDLISVAYILLRLFGCDLGEAQLSHHDIHRGHQAPDGIDQRAVKIKKSCFNHIIILLLFAVAVIVFSCGGVSHYSACPYFIVFSFYFY